MEEFLKANLFEQQAVVHIDNFGGMWIGGRDWSFLTKKALAGNFVAGQQVTIHITALMEKNELGERSD